MGRKPFRFFWEDDAWDELNNLHRDVHRMMNEFWRGVPEMSFSRSFPVDVSETDKEIIVKADLPGVEKENVSLRVEDNRLIIDVEHSEEKREEKENFFRQERRYGSLHREILLPVEVDEENAEAEMKNGVLTVRFPKKDEAKRKGKEIKIK